MSRRISATRARPFGLMVLFFALLAIAIASRAAFAQGDGSAAYLADRGTGLPTSMFGTFIRKGELLVYPFFEYYRDDDFEYKPVELGYGLDQDFRGKFRASEGILFLGYGLSDRLAIELEASIIDATQEKDPSDPSAVPARIEESGLGDVEGQIRFRWAEEREKRPEIFSYFEAVSPQQRDKLLIGTPDWELKLGAGLVKGYPWGTLMARSALEYTLEDSQLDAGEYAFEYLKRLSSAWRVYLGVEGFQDEVEGITELQWHFSDAAFLKLNNAFGLTSKATDWAPEVGIMFSIPANR